jgi:hypothetical protein
MKNLLEVTNTIIKIKILKSLIKYHYMICCKLKFCMEHIPKKKVSLLDVLYIKIEST